jgi:predicted secreted protein
MSTRVLTYQDCGQTIELRPGETAEIQLKENPSTGYRWSVASPPDPA